jgi:hypothetical protein
MPSGDASPACSAIVQQFVRGNPASNPSRNNPTRRRGSTRTNRDAIRATSSSKPRCQTIRVYAVARSHRATVLSPHNPRSSTGGCATSGTATPPDHESRLETRRLGAP